MATSADGPHRAALLVLRLEQATHGAARPRRRRLHLPSVRAVGRAATQRRRAGRLLIGPQAVSARRRASRSSSNDGTPFSPVEVRYTRHATPTAAPASANGSRSLTRNIGEPVNPRARACSSESMTVVVTEAETSSSSSTARVRSWAMSSFGHSGTTSSSTSMPPACPTVLRPPFPRTGASRETGSWPSTISR